MSIPRKWWLLEDKKILYSNRVHRVLDDEQARTYQEIWDGAYGPPDDAIRVIEFSAYQELSEKLAAANDLIEAIKVIAQDICDHESDSYYRALDVVEVIKQYRKNGTKLT